MTSNAYLSPSKHTKQLLFVKFCDTPAGIEVSFQTDKGAGWRGTVAEGNTDMKIEIVI